MSKSWNLAEESYASSIGHLREHGLAVYGTFLFGYDNDDAETIRQSVRFAREQKLFLAAFNHLVPFPGTPLYQRLEQEGRLLTRKWWLDPEATVGQVVFRPQKLSPDELAQLCLEARREFYRLAVNARQNVRPARERRQSTDAGGVSEIEPGFAARHRFAAGVATGCGAGTSPWEPIDEPIPF